MLIFKKYFILFLCYSFIGWIIEIIWTFFNDKKIVNRGFLIGPYCPIYGVGCILLILLLDSYKNNLVLLFFISILLCSVLEYLTSFFMEKLFKARWWDYSNYRFNLNGRICVNTMIPFGILGVLVICYLNPLIITYIKFNNIIFYILLSLFLIDLCLSFGIITGLRNTITCVARDNTEEITKKVKEIIFKKSFLYNRLIKAFPNFKSPIDRLKEFVSRN